MEKHIAVGLFAWGMGLGSIAATVPEELVSTGFAGPDIVPSPACLCAAPTGEVFVGVDMNGSLGKGAGKGKIVRLIDTDQDGKADSHTVFADIDNPRGLISVGDQLFVLHTVIPAETGKMTGMHLSVLADANGDGKADGPPKRLVSDISTLLHNQKRGADHTTNGIQMGIDGWIYIAVGDFGMVDATGSDGRKLTLLGGGVMRVRPDGTEMEMYTLGLRNIYDVAIDPFMNIYTRGNTNDGGGWNVRFIHHIQTGQYGYPMLYKHFTGEMLPALQDLGGGSGTGATFFAEPGWPEKYTNVPMMCDWGRSQLVIHRLTPDGPSFTQEPEEFIKTKQISDVDVDGSGRMYLSAWDGAGYKGSASKGFVDRVVPKGWTYKPFPNLRKMTDGQVFNGLRTASAVTRLHAQQELLRRKSTQAIAPCLKLAGSVEASLESRVAALFTAKQLGASAQQLASLADDAAMREFVLRAMTDRVTQLQGVPVARYLEGLKDADPRVQVASAVGLGRLGDAAAGPALLAVSNPPEGTYRPQPASAKAPKPAFVGKERKAHQKATKIDVKVEGWKELHLVVGEGSDGNGNDHVAWIEPVLILKDGTEKKLTELKWKSAAQGWGKTLVNADCISKPLQDQDGKPVAFGIGSHTPSHIVYDLPADAVGFKAHGGSTPGGVGGRAYVQFIVNDSPPIMKKESDVGPHATPNSPVVVPHIAVRALERVGAVDAALHALSGPNRAGAIWALQGMHVPAAVDGLLAQLPKQADASQRMEILALLARLYQREAPYDGSWWWSTRPDTRGPYYKPITWEKSEAIAAVLKKAYAEGDATTQQALAFWNMRLRLGFSEMGQSKLAATEVDEPKVDLGAIAGKAGEVGKTSIEDVMLAMDDLKGNVKRGQKLFTQQGCVACHTLSSDEPPKGPYMGQVGAILSREQIAESILKPNASISQGFASVSISLKDETPYLGFVSAETADDIELRDIAGNVHKIKKKDIASRQELEISIMPPGLASALTLQEFVDLVDFLAGKKK